MDTNSEKNRLIMADVVAQTWNDPKFKAKVLDDPKKVLVKAGVEGIGDNHHIVAHANSDNKKYIVLPAGLSPHQYMPQLSKFLSRCSPLDPNLELSLVQNAHNTTHVVLPVRPPSGPGKLDASHAHIAAAAGWEAINLYTSANVAGEANAAGVQNAVGATEVAGAAVAVAVVGVVLT
ncbi:MAG: nitrile hydratase subunit alpha [Bacteroidota bacterium]